MTDIELDALMQMTKWAENPIKLLSRLPGQNYGSPRNISFEIQQCRRAIQDLIAERDAAQGKLKLREKG